MATPGKPIQETSLLAHSKGKPVFPGRERRTVLGELDANIQASPSDNENVIQVIVRAHWSQFLQFLNINELRRELRRLHLVTEEEEDELKKYNREGAAQHLLSEILPRKCKDAFSKFYEALCSEKTHLGHSELAELITKNIS